MQCLLVLFALLYGESHGQELFGYASFAAGNPFFQQPNYPPHLRPLAFPQYSYQPFRQPALAYNSVFQQNQPFSNDIRWRVPLPDFYQPFTHYEDPYQDINEISRDPIQIIPSRFPPRVENWVERIQNRFSVYNPVPVVPAGPSPYLILTAAAPNSTLPNHENLPTSTDSSAERLTQVPTEPSEEVDQMTETNVSSSETDQMTETKVSSSEPDQVTEEKVDQAEETTALPETTTQASEQS